MSKVDKAVFCFKNGFNCSQAIFSTYGPDYGIPAESCLKIAENFGGGIVYLGNTCGAVTGAIMVIGAKYGRMKPDEPQTKAIANELGKKFVKKFEKRNNTISCKRLLNFDISTDGKIKEAREKEIFVNCPNYVRDAAEILEDLLNVKFTKL